MSDIHSDALDQLATALAAAQAEFSAIPKDSTNPFFKSKFAGLPKVIEVASPVLTKHGLSVSQHIGYDGEYDTLTTWLLHKSGQFIASTMRLHLVKDDPQGQGSATTYAKRYSYMAALGLVADEDDDANKAVSGRQRASAPATARQPARVDPDSLDALRRRFKDTGWTPETLAMQLTAVGAQDVSDVRAAMQALSPEQARQLLSAMNAACDEQIAAQEALQEQRAGVA